MAIGIFGLIPSSSPDELRKILQTLSTKWGDVIEDLESLEVKPMKGAMTNEVFMVSWPRKETNLRCRKLLVRVYGEGVELFFNRDDEIRTFEFVARHGHGPRLLGRFAGGRVEEFIHARVTYIPFFYSYNHEHPVSFIGPQYLLAVPGVFNSDLDSVFWYFITTMV